MRGAAAASLVSSASQTLLRLPLCLRRCIPATFATLQKGQCQLSQQTHANKPTHKTISTFHRLMATSTSPSGENAPQVPKSVPVRVALELLQAGHRYLDVRTKEEFSAGHALGAVNVPYMFKVGDGMQKNLNFVEEVSKHFVTDTEIIVGCQSGKRSLMAANDLSSAGFNEVTDIAGGYSAWKQNGLPTE